MNLRISFEEKFNKVYEKLNEIITKKEQEN